MSSSPSWDTWDVDERFVRQIIEAANRRAGKIITDEDKARRQRQMKNAEKVKELAMAISKKNNSVAERVRCYIRHSQEVEEDIRKLTQNMIEVKVQRLKEEFDRKLAKHRQVLHSDLCTYFPLSEIARLEDSIEQLRKVD
uniref:BZIP domain-containing protein n=1 Tax=Haemonchus contortus TaxID=6289 RepID=A0A7I4YC22_HAECO